MPVQDDHRQRGKCKEWFQGCSGNLMPNCKAQLGFKSSPRFQGAEWEMLLALAFSRTGSNPSETRRSIEHSGTTGIFFFKVALSRDRTPK